MSSGDIEEKLSIVKNDPAVFAKYILEFTPFPYQERLLQDRSKRVIAVCGRQIGKPTLAAIRLIHYAITHRNTTSVIVSATLRQSMETFGKVRSFVNWSKFVSRFVTEASRTQIFFKNGSRIVCLPSGRYGSTLRGLTVHFAVVDEAAFIYDEVITNAILPMLSTTEGRVWLLTTPWSKDHVTYKCFTSGDWSVYHLPSSVNPLVKGEFLEEQRRLIGEERFDMEYNALFIDEMNSYFPMKLLMSCVEDYELMKGDLKGLYGGQDPGGKDSQAAFVVVERANDILRVVYLRAAHDSSYTQYNVEVADFHGKHPLVKHTVDQTGIGNPIAEHLKELQLPVEGLTLTSRVREELLSNLRILFEGKKIKIPNDRQLLNSLNCIEYERTRTGGYDFTHRQGTYDDLAYALALAVYGLRYRPPVYTIVGVTKPFVG